MSLRTPNRNNLKNVAAINLASSNKKVLPPENIGLKFETEEELAAWEQIVSAKPSHDWRKVDLMRLMGLVFLYVQRNRFWETHRHKALTRDEIHHINQIERGLSVITAALGLSVPIASPSNPFVNATVAAKNGEFSSPLLKGASLNG